LRRTIAADAPHFDVHNEAPAHIGADPAVWNAIGMVGVIDAKLSLASPISDFYLTNPIARASATMAECSRVFIGGAAKMAAE
jgi:NADH-quinone oxidoreductase subunit G